MLTALGLCTRSRSLDASNNEYIYIGNVWVIIERRGDMGKLDVVDGTTFTTPSPYSFMDDLTKVLVGFHLGISSLTHHLGRGELQCVVLLNVFPFLRGASGGKQWGTQCVNSSRRVT